MFASNVFYEEIGELTKEYFEPPKLKIVQRFQFNNRGEAKCEQLLIMRSK